MLILAFVCLLILLLLVLVASLADGIDGARLFLFTLIVIPIAVLAGLIF